MRVLGILLILISSILVIVWKINNLTSQVGYNPIETKLDIGMFACWMVGMILIIKGYDKKEKK